MKLEFGFQLANIESARIRDLAQAAEALDFDYIVFPDHIVLEGPERQFDAHGLAWDMVSVAASVIAATEKIRVAIDGSKCSSAIRSFFASASLTRA